MVVALVSGFRAISVKLVLFRYRLAPFPWKKPLILGYDILFWKLFEGPSEIQNAWFNVIFDLIWLNYNSKDSFQLNWKRSIKPFRDQRFSLKTHFLVGCYNPILNRMKHPLSTYTHNWIHNWNSHKYCTMKKRKWKKESLK